MRYLMLPDLPTRDDTPHVGTIWERVDNLVLPMFACLAAPFEKKCFDAVVFCCNGWHIKATLGAWVLQQCGADLRGFVVP